MVYGELRDLLGDAWSKDLPKSGSFDADKREGRATRSLLPFINSKRTRLATFGLVPRRANRTRGSHGGCRGTAGAMRRSASII
jgi:hypothetical protein